MKKLIPFSVLFFSLFSCKNNDNIVQFRALDESLRISNSLISGENIKISSEMDDKLKDPQTKSKAEIWQPKAQRVEQLSAIINRFIDSLKINLKKHAGLTASDAKGIYNENDKSSVTLLFEKQNKASELFNRLINFKQAITESIHPDDFSDNPFLRKDLILKSNDFKTSLITYIRIDTSDPKTNIISTYFQNTSAFGAITMLEKIQNDVLKAENTMLNYFNNRAVSYRDLVYDKFSAIVTKSSSYLKAGETLEVYAGMGSFSTASKPTFTINGIKVPVDVDGVSIYKLKIDKKPGKYFMPVKIEFTKPDGSPATVTKQIEYTVAL